MSSTSEPFLWVSDTQASAGQGLLSAAVAYCCRYLLPPGAHVGQLHSLVFKKCLRPCSYIGLYRFFIFFVVIFPSNFPLSMMKELPPWKVASIENSLSITCHSKLATLNQLLLLFFSSLHICLRKLSRQFVKAACAKTVPCKFRLPS